MKQQQSADGGGLDKVEEEDGSESDDEDECDDDEDDDGELSLQDRIDDALDESCKDAKLMRALLDEAKQEGCKHPSLESLRNKCSAQEEEDDNDSSGKSKKKDTKRAASTQRRMSVAASGIGGVIAEAGMAAALSGQVGEQMFDAKLKGKKKALQLKVGQMNVQLFDGQKVLESFLYVTVRSWEYDPKKKIFKLEVQRPGGKQHTCELVLPGGKSDGKAICELMEKHALGIAKAMKQQQSADGGGLDKVEEEDGSESEENEDENEVQCTKRFKVLGQLIVREGFQITTTQTGTIEAGEVVDVLGTRKNEAGKIRMRFAGGWVTKTKRLEEVMYTEEEARDTSEDDNESDASSIISRINETELEAVDENAEEALAEALAEADAKAVAAAAQEAAKVDEQAQAAAAEAALLAEAEAAAAEAALLAEAEAEAAEAALLAEAEAEAAEAETALLAEVEAAAATAEAAAAAAADAAKTALEAEAAEAAQLTEKADVAIAEAKTEAAAKAAKAARLAAEAEAEAEAARLAAESMEADEVSRLTAAAAVDEAAAEAAQLAAAVRIEAVEAARRLAKAAEVAAKAEAEAQEAAASAAVVAEEMDVLEAEAANRRALKGMAAAEAAVHATVAAVVAGSEETAATKDSDGLNLNGNEAMGADSPNANGGALNLNSTDAAEWKVTTRTESDLDTSTVSQEGLDGEVSIQELAKLHLRLSGLKEQRMIDLALYNSLNNAIGDAQESAQHVDASVKTAARLSTIFPDDGHFATQLKRKIMHLQSTPNGEGAGAAVGLPMDVVALQKEVLQLRGEVGRLCELLNSAGTRESRVPAQDRVSLEGEATGNGNLQETQTTARETEAEGSREEQTTGSPTRPASPEKQHSLIGLLKHHHDAHLATSPTPRHSTSSASSSHLEVPRAPVASRSPRSLAKQLIELKSMLDNGEISTAAFYEQKLELSQQIMARRAGPVGPPSSPVPPLRATSAANASGAASGLRLSPAQRRTSQARTQASLSAAARVSSSMGRKDAARGLALASLLRQVAVSELLPRLHARLGVSSVVELSELEPDDFNGLQVCCQRHSDCPPLTQFLSLPTQ